MPPSKAESAHIAIEETKIILAEGADAYWFLIWAYQEWDVSGVQVLDFGGITQLTSYLNAFRKLEGFEQVRSLVVARDAETSAASAFEQVKTSLAKTSFPVPESVFAFAVGEPQTAVMLFPGLEATSDQLRETGTLEDLCLSTVADDPLFVCVDEFVDCAKRVAADTDERLVHPRKARLHAFLAGKQDFTGYKLGEATKMGAWDLNHPAMAPFRKLIGAMPS